MSDTTPKLAIVGHPNKGKSSIVATLSYNDEVEVSSISGTTLRAQAYPFVLDSVTLYTLYDTPGFQRPRQLLSWLEKNASNASERLSAVKKFIDTFKNDAQNFGKYLDEIELLQPIIDGAGIVYVVDGSRPYSLEYEAEMTILQWTGRPRMALINPIGECDEKNIADWHQALGQFFSIVKVFNPMNAGVSKHVELLRAYSELDTDCSMQLDSAIKALEKKTINVTTAASNIIAQAVADILSFSLSAPVAEGGNTPDVTNKIVAKTQDVAKESLQYAFKQALVKKEKERQKQLLQLYAFYHLSTTQAELNIDLPDLFDEDTWYLFGLTKPKILSLCAGAGAAAGAVIDVGMLGGSLLMGSLTGSIIGGAAGVFFQSNIDQIKISGMPFSGKKIVIGPIKNMHFAFVVLGRFLNFTYKLSKRAHADRNTLAITEDKSWVNALSKTEQIVLTQTLLKCADKNASPNIDKLSKIIHALISDHGTEKEKVES